jgi:hypothetical protein
VERWIGWDEGQAGGRGRRRAGRKNQGNISARISLESKGNEGERGGAAGEERGSEEDSKERRATHGSPQEASTTTHQSKLAWALQWLPDDDPCRPLRLRKRVMQIAQQSWHSMRQASAKSPAPSTSIEAPPSTDVLALQQLLRKPKMAMAVQIRTQKNGFNTFLYQARVPSVLSPLCSCGFGHQTAKHIIIHCRNFSAARHALRDNQGRLPDSRELVMTPTGLKNVTKWLMQRGILGQYQRARGLLYPPGCPSPAYN